MSWLTLCEPRDCSPPSSSVHGISEARILEWVAISFLGDLLYPGIETASPELAGWFFITEPPVKPRVVGLLLFSGSVMSDPLEAHDCNMPGFPVLHYLPKLAQTHIHWVSGTIQSSCPLLSPSHPSFNLSQHQGLF